MTPPKYPLTRDKMSLVLPSIEVLVRGLVLSANGAQKLNGLFYHCIVTRYPTFVALRCPWLCVYLCVCGGKES